MRPFKPRVQRDARRSRHIMARMMYPGSADRRCVVSNISFNGAKIIVEGAAAIPAYFELAFAEGTRHLLCERIWQHGKTVGVKFVR
jgi:hypothetical protein